MKPVHVYIYGGDGKDEKAGTWTHAGGVLRQDDGAGEGGGGLVGPGGES